MRKGYQLPGFSANWRAFVAAILSMGYQSPSQKGVIKRAGWSLSEHRGSTTRRLPGAVGF